MKQLDRVDSKQCVGESHSGGGHVHPMVDVQFSPEMRVFRSRNLVKVERSYDVNIVVQLVMKEMTGSTATPVVMYFRDSFTKPSDADQELSGLEALRFAVAFGDTVAYVSGIPGIKFDLNGHPHTEDKI